LGYQGKSVNSERFSCHSYFKYGSFNVKILEEIPEESDSWATLKQAKMA